MQIFSSFLHYLFCEVKMFVSSNINVETLNISSTEEKCVIFSYLGTIVSVFTSSDIMFEWRSVRSYRRASSVFFHLHVCFTPDTFYFMFHVKAPRGAFVSQGAARTQRPRLSDEQLWTNQPTNGSFGTKRRGFIAALLGEAGRVHRYIRQLKVF